MPKPKRLPKLATDTPDYWAVGLGPDLDARGCHRRRAAPADLDGIVTLGVQALERKPQAGLKLDREKLFSMARECVTGAGNYAYVVEHQGVIVAAVLALVTEMMCYKGRQANVVQFYSIKPGQGARLIRHFMAWYRSRPLIRQVLFTLDEPDERTEKLLRHLGISPSCPVYVNQKL